MAAVLEVKGLKAYYGQTQSLYDVGFDVATGGITTLLGANGAGKTTTLRAICNMVRTEGAVRFDGKDIAGRRPRRSCGCGVAHVPEGRGTFTTLTVEENLRIAAYTRCDKAGREARARAGVQLFPAAEGAHPAAGRHAVGRRAADAGDRPRADAEAAPDAARRAVVRPGAADRGQEIFRILRRINEEEKVSMLLVEQNAALALELADHAYVLETGRVVMSGPSAVVKNDENIRKSYLGY